MAVDLKGCVIWLLVMIMCSPVWLYCAAVQLFIFLRSPLTYFKRNVRPLESFEDPCPLEHQFHKVNGVRLHVAVGGRPKDPGSKPLMLFVHGFPEGWFCWRYQLKAFMESHEVAAVEMRGYGLSEKPKGRSPYRMHELVQDLSELIPALGHKKCVLVSHDWGAAVSWAFAFQHADQLERLVALSVPPPKLFAQNMDAAQLKKSLYMANIQSPLIPELMMSAQNFRVLEEMLTKSPYGLKNQGNISSEEVARYKANIAQPGALTATMNYYRAMIDARTWNPSPRGRVKPSKTVDVPVLVIGGKDDAAIGTHLFKNIEKMVPDVQLHFLSNCSHWVQQDRPEDVNRLIADFVKASPRT
mmetsp:Transcript_7462/g.22060  ORF Transcript_7462/g.22060 Transcript_7462/m.22060 type:complete len:356 (+) Transcript_7462:174-1241(+)